MAVAKVKTDKPYIVQIFDVTEGIFWEMTDEDMKCDLLDGVLYVHSPASIRHERLFRFLFNLLSAYVERIGLGEVLGSRAVMDLGPLRKFEPDIMFVKRENMARIEEEALRGPADLVVEVASEGTKNFDYGEKRKAYMEAEVPEIWLIDPLERRVTVCRKIDGEYREEEVSEGWISSAVAEGFKLRAEWLFSDPLPLPLQCLEEILRSL